MRGCLERKRSGFARNAGKRSSSTTTGARHAGTSRTGKRESVTFRETGRKITASSGSIEPGTVLRASRDTNMHMRVWL